MQYGEWSTPDPSFVGEIVVDDNNTFCGYCDELYESRKSETRFLAGAIAPNGRNGKNGIAFYKMSNDKNQPPLLYIVPELENGKGEWAEASWNKGFFTIDEAMVEIEEKPTAALEEGEKLIKAKFNELDKSIDLNRALLEQIQCCIDIIINAK